MKIPNMPTWAWDELRKAGSSKFSQAAIFVPVLGYFILFGESANQYFQLTFDSDRTFSFWRIYWLYFGFTTIALAQVLFNWYCPPEIKQHGTAYEFVAREERTISKAREEGMRDFLKRRNFAMVKAPDDPTYDSADDQNARFPPEIHAGHFIDKFRRTRAIVNEMELPELMVEYAVAQKTAEPRLRKLITNLYASGLVMVLVPTLTTLWQVGVSAINRGIAWAQIFVSMA